MEGLRCVRGAHDFHSPLRLSLMAFLTLTLFCWKSNHVVYPMTLSYLTLHVAIAKWSMGLDGLGDPRTNQNPCLRNFGSVWVLYQFRSVDVTQLERLSPWCNSPIQSYSVVAGPLTTVTDKGCYGLDQASNLSAWSQMLVCLAKS